MLKTFHLLRSVLLIFTCCGLLFGCGPKKSAEPDLEELVTPYTPRDDGKTLTPKELQAFNSTGDLDTNLSSADKKIVELHFKFFVHDNRKTMERFITRSARFLPYAQKIFAQRGLPKDLVYLFMIESGGNPKAYSPAKAAGLWQFIPSTGRKYGLYQDSWIDERRDPFKSTFAASDYLLKLHSDFKNWHLAAAAYNAGEGKIGRALSNTNAPDFFELYRVNHTLEGNLQLREETKIYVPRIIAVAKVMRNLRLLGFTEPSLSAAYQPVAVVIPPNVTLRQLARGAGLSWEDFSAMNPAYLRTTTPPSRNTTAYFPAANAQLAKNWLDSDKRKLYSHWQEYTLKKGDTVQGIAKARSTSADAIYNANDISRLPAAGTTIMLPPPPKATQKATGGTHVIKPGESLSGIARKYGLSVQQLCSINGITPKTVIKSGQRLKVNNKTEAAPQKTTTPQKTVTPKPTQAKQPATTTGAKTTAPQSSKGTAKKPATITVQSGDTLYSIARKYAVSLKSLQKANKLSPKSTLRVGQKLRIP